ncbi:hypothetical protein CS542_04075 [Pedobacter sp. IW39]|nr:hypothetical protein CS542_04075 [Pedobacter sp. IW39]
MASIITPFLTDLYFRRFISDIQSAAFLNQHLTYYISHQDQQTSRIIEGVIYGEYRLIFSESGSTTFHLPITGS